MNRDRLLSIANASKITPFHSTVFLFAPCHIFFHNQFKNNELGVSINAAIGNPCNTAIMSLEFYGFVVYVATFLSSSVWFCWSFFPDKWLEYCKIEYYPSK